ncbi:MAG TPA: hypothetical protein VNC61_12375 [Acidimicrobiales bacterium]|nr:hypothetical protein [Acidimicrobiales bacterium]
MRSIRLSGPTTLLLVALVAMSSVLVVATPALAAGKHPAVKVVSPVCVSGLDVSVNGVVNWKTGAVGTLNINWGDGTNSPSPFPAWHAYAGPGTFTITMTATNTSGSGTAARSVTVGPSAATCVVTISYQPVAEGGTLNPGQSSGVLVTVTKPSGRLIKAQEPVWLSFVPTAGGGTATACCTATGADVALSSTPALFITGLAGPPGEIVVDYVQPQSLPLSGTDVITAAAVPQAPAPGSVSTSYQFSSSPVPLTPPSTIASDCTVDVSTSLGPWLRNLPPHADVEIPPGACYQVDEGLFLKFPTDLTINGGTYENLSAAPVTSGGSGTQRGNPVFNVLGGSDLTLENMTISGANPGGYNAKMAFAAGIVLQGTQHATIENIDINHTYGDGITLNPLRNAANHKGPVIVAATADATIDNVVITGPGRMGIAFVSVDGAAVSSVTIDDVGLDTFDVEADQADEGSRNVTIDGCTASTSGKGDFFANGGSSSGKATGDITVENCTEEQPQNGTAIWVRRSGTGLTNRGPFLFDNDTIACGTSILVACVIDSGGTVTIQDSTLTFPPGTPPNELVYEADTSAVLTFSDDTVSGYGLTADGYPGTADTTSTVTVLGGTWTPAS